MKILQKSKYSNRAVNLANHTEIILHKNILHEIFKQTKQITVYCIVSPEIVVRKYLYKCQDIDICTPR